jgi:hypothetical protein
MSIRARLGGIQLEVRRDQGPSELDASLEARTTTDTSL